MGVLTGPVESLLHCTFLLQFISSVNTKSGIGHRLILKRMEENGNLQVTVGRQRMPHFSILALISDTFYNKAR